MAGDFDVRPLGTVAKVRSGYAFKSDDMGAVGLPIIKIKNVAPPTVDITDCERVPEEVISSIPRVERFELKEGDTLIAMTGATVGKVGRFPRTKERHFLNQRVGKVYLTEPDAADYRYIYFILSQDTYVRQMFGIADGSAQANISGSQIESLEVPLPPLPEQRAIAHVLGTLDDLIELNRETNEILEEMARALFKSWFVDFDPVRAKLEGRPPAGMDAATAALFPDHFQDSELGQIPNGWEVGSVYEICSVTYGVPFASKLFNSSMDGRPLIRIRDLPGECPGVWTEEVHPKGYLVQPGDIVVGMDGEFRAYLWGGEEAWLNQRVCVFAPKNGFSPAFVRNSIVSPLAQVEATEIATTVIHLGKNDIHCRPTVWTWRALSLEFARRHEGFGGMPIASFLRVVDISFE
jgi:type I restriction enzyme S subunit